MSLLARSFRIHQVKLDYILFNIVFGSLVTERKEAKVYSVSSFMPFDSLIRKYQKVDFNEKVLFKLYLFSNWEEEGEKKKLSILYLVISCNVYTFVNLSWCPVLIHFRHTRREIFLECIESGSYVVRFCSCTLLSCIIIVHQTLGDINNKCFLLFCVGQVQARGGACWAQWPH